MKTMHSSPLCPQCNSHRSLIVDVRPISAHRARVRRECQACKLRTTYIRVVKQSKGRVVISEFVATKKEKSLSKKPKQSDTSPKLTPYAEKLLSKHK